MPTNDELQRAREAVDEAKAGVAEARGLDWQATALSVLVDELESLSTAQQQRIAELEKDLASARVILRDYEDVLQNTLAPYALPGDDMEMAVGRVLKRIEALEKALEPFANMGYIFVNSKTIHPSYNGQDREIYSLNDAVLTRRDFERAYEALHADKEGVTMRDERIMTDDEVQQMATTATRGWALDAAAHMTAVNEQLKQIEKFTTDKRVLKLVREMLYGDEA